MKLKTLIIVIVLIITGSVYSQQVKNPYSELSDDQYSVINNLFKSKGSQVNIVSITDFSKSWSFLINSDILDSLLEHCVKNDSLIKWNDIASKKKQRYVLL